MKKYILQLLFVFLILPFSISAQSDLDYSGYYSRYRSYFKNAICSELLPEYAAMTDEQMLQLLNGMPAPLVKAALKIKNGWGEYEKEFRVAEYAPYAKTYDWSQYLKTNPYSDLNNPTGICCSLGDTVMVFVDESVYYPNSLTFLQVKDNEAIPAKETYLYKGLNVIIISVEDATLYIKYAVETNREDSSKRISDFPNLAIHIEGGYVNGYFDKKRHTNEDWVDMQEKILKHPVVDVKGDNAMFHMHRNAVVAACPDNIYESIDGWDTMVQWQLELMGAMQYRDRWNNLIMCCDGTQSGNMYATWFYTFYPTSFIKDLLPWESILKNPGNVWGPAHEIGHMNQGAINVVSCTEVSNNLFSNMVVQRIGKTTTRGMMIDECIKDYNNKVPFPLRSEVFSKTRMYWQLYLYFHEAGFDKTFYPRLFEYLRDNPLSTTTGVNGKFNQLRFAEACCEVAQMDLSEFFEVWGFFEPMNNAYVGDYADYYVTLSKEDAEASRVAMQKYSKKGGHLMFLEDRVKPSKRGDGAEGYRKNWSDEVPVGSAGDVGQWEDYINQDAEAVGYVYDLTGTKITIALCDGASGAVGFKVYNAAGERIAWSNRYSFAVPQEYSNADVTVVAVQANGEECCLKGFAYGEETQQLVALEKALESAYSILQLATDDSRPGFYKESAVVELRLLFENAYAAKNNSDISVHSYGEWSLMLNDAINALLANVDALIDVDPQRYYTLHSFYSESYALTQNGTDVVCTNAKNVPVTDASKQWMFVETATDGVYYIKNGNGGYIKEISAGLQAELVTDMSAAGLFVRCFSGNGLLSFVSKDNADIAIAYRSTGKIAIGDDADKSQCLWIVTVANSDTALERVEDSADSSILYDFSGRRVERAEKGGFYITNGRKVLIID